VLLLGYIRTFMGPYGSFPALKIHTHTHTHTRTPHTYTYIYILYVYYWVDNKMSMLISHIQFVSSMESFPHDFKRI
jgi:hypothetical protein